MIIGPEGIKMKEEKVKDVLDWLTSQEVKNVQKFLRLANYYPKFIKDFATIARPLYNMIKRIRSGSGLNGRRRHLEN